MITLDVAQEMIVAAQAEARRRGAKIVIAVADEGAHLVALARMDGAWIGAIDIAVDKAFTARAFDKATGDLAAFTQSGGRVFGLNTTNRGRVVIFGGGIPVVNDGAVVGGVGVSGSTADVDIAIAEAAVAGFAARGATTASVGESLALRE